MIKKRKKMNKKLIVVNVLLFVVAVLTFVWGIFRLGRELHELFAWIFVVLGLIHLFLNRNWLKAVFHSKPKGSEINNQ